MTFGLRPVFKNTYQHCPDILRLCNAVLITSLLISLDWEAVLLLASTVSSVYRKLLLMMCILGFTLNLMRSLMSLSSHAAVNDQDKFKALLGLFYTFDLFFFF